LREYPYTDWSNERAPGARQCYAPMEVDNIMERLQRVLASSGITSRRKAEELIVAGRVRVDGQIVTQLGTQVDPERQKIEVDGKLIPRARLRYIVLHKPSGYITTTADERGRYTVMDLVPVNERVVPVGRLDRQTEGLLLLTNDGEIAHRVMHPRFEIEKEYEALLDGHPPAELLERVRRGVTIDGQRTVPSVVRPMRNTEDGTVVKVVIHEGRNRVVRKMFEEIGYPVLRLIRVRVGPLQLGSIPRGTWRDLTDGELSQLREAVHLEDEDVVAQRHPDWGKPAPRKPATPRGPGPRARPAPLRGGAPAGDRRPARPDRGPGPPRRGPVKPGRQAGPRPASDGERAQRRDGDGSRERDQRQSEFQRGGEHRSGPAQRPRRPGGGSGQPPIHDRDRRPGGGGKEHGRRDRRPPA